MRTAATNSGDATQLLHRRAITLALCLPFSLRGPMAHAAMGAAELDLQFYARSLIGLPSAPQVQPNLLPLEPRQLDGELAALVVRESTAAVASALGTDSDDIIRLADVQRPRLSMEFDRALSSGAFGSGGYDTAGYVGARKAQAVPTDQFSLDLSLLALFSVLSDRRLSKAELAAFYARLGDALLKGLPAGTLLRAPAPSTFAGVTNGLRTLLASLKGAGYIREFAIDDSDADEGLWSQQNELSVTRLVITLTDSAALQASLLLNGRISPEVTGPLIQAYLRSCGLVVGASTEYFLDDTWRPNPLDYRPSQWVLDLSVRPGPMVR